MANLTTKELSALEDQLGLEQVLVKKYTSEATQCSDTALRNHFESIAQKHQQHFDTLTGYLK